MKKDDARSATLAVLNQFAKPGSNLDKCVDAVMADSYQLTPKNRALFNALVYGIVRWQGRLDYVIARFSKTKLSKIRPDILNVIRLGVFQILYMDKIPDSAAVNTSVELAKQHGPLWVVRFVNGILRNISRQKDDISDPDISTDPIKAVASRYSFPSWMVKRWIDRWGVNETIELCTALNTIPPLTLRANSLKTDRDQLKEILSTEVTQIEETTWASHGLRCFGLSKPVFEWSAFKNGLFQVQDEAAQLVTQCLQPLPGQAILDACAGLGTKTGHLAQFLKNSGQLIALDHDPRKLTALAAEMNRLQVLNVSTITTDLEQPLDRKLNGRFDGVVLDAPCTGLGVIRRNPDIKWKRKPDLFARYQKRQLLFLKHCCACIKPGGTLVYSVCTIEPEETDQVVEAFLKDHKQFELIKPDLPGKDGMSSLYDGKYIRTFPHLHNMDGFFIACIRKSNQDRTISSYCES